MLMRPSSLAVMPRTLLALLFWTLLPLSAHAFWQITYPNSTTQWVNGQQNQIRWVKGLMDDVVSFDIELARLSTDGLLFLAKDVPTKKNFGMNVVLQDVIPADDYFLLFLNSTHGRTYAVSDRFTIASSGSPGPTASGATITVSGSPNPTQEFAVTFPASAALRVADWRPAHVLLGALAGALGAAVVGGAWAIV